MGLCTNWSYECINVQLCVHTSAKILAVIYYLNSEDKGASTSLYDLSFVI